jgi:hypothetical protein
VRILLRLLLASVVACLLAACQSADASGVGSSSKDGGHAGSAGSQQVKVVVDIFSGVSNPTWTLSADDTAQIADILGDLEQQGTVSEPIAGLDLGFRGFVLHGLDLSAFGTYNEVRALGDTVIVSGGAGDSAVLADPDRRLYRAVRDLAKQHVETTIFSQIPDNGVRGA